MSSDLPLRVTQGPGRIDFFICHASEDKRAAARPIYDELVRRGHSVWLDEAELTLGDSLRQSIDYGLANCRFGVVILSRAFFQKNWPQYELDGLMDRQMSGTKTVLPVWHDIRHDDIAVCSPSLAGLYAASTSNGIAAVVDEIVRAYVKATVPQGTHRQAADTGEVPTPARLHFPLFDGERARLVSDHPDYWEYLLFADALTRGLLAHEPAWRDHQLRLIRPNGPVVPKEQILAYVSQASQDMARNIDNLPKLLSPGALQAALGPPGQSGDAELIEHLCQRVTAVYGQYLEWAAEVRSVRCSSDFNRLFEILGSMADNAIGQFRTFVEECASQFSDTAALTEGDEPITIHFTLVHESIDDVLREYKKELKRLKRRRKL